jgi:putative hydrolase of the HAD superfamily
MNLSLLKRLDTNVLIFDLFHTLTDYESKLTDLPSIEDILHVDIYKWNYLLDFESKDRITGVVKDDFKILRNLANKIDITIPDEKVNEAVCVNKERFRAALTNIPKRTIDTLHYLKNQGYRLSLLSNADVMEIAAWDESPLASIFEATTFSCYVGYEKPEREIYEIAVNALQVRPNDCVFVGDGGSNELRGAKEIGMKTILITGIIEHLWPERIPELREMADNEIRYISDLLE